jgi:hypothetical protein
VQLVILDAKEGAKFYPGSSLYKLNLSNKN